MKMHQISYFLAVCDEKSFTRAARRCGVKQPSITVAIRQLENEIGGPLFERNNSAIRLTSLGNLVRPDFARIDRCAAAIKCKAAKFIATHAAPNKSKAREAHMRVIAVSVATLAILMLGLALRPTPSATVALPEQASARIDPYALELTIDIKFLPDLTIENSI
jgi:Bacterial regulatory helix-turn-helix protein, lysR family